MKKTSVLWPILCSALVFASASAARAGTYGDTEEAEETPQSTSAAAAVEEEEGWTFVITPQLWVPHIDSGGFSGNSSLGVVTNVLNPVVPNVTFQNGSSEAVDPVDLQWGFQLGARKGRWAFAAGYQHTDFTTRTDVVYDGQFDITNNFTGTQLLRGTTVAQEFVSVDRTDVDLAASYTIPDVVPNRLDVAVGGGLKMIYASSDREYSNMNAFIAEINALEPPGLYEVCEGNNVCSGGSRFKQRVNGTDWMYGITIPLAVVTHLSDDGKWLLPLNVAPFIGAETRDDNDVVYAQNLQNGFPVSVDRQDGTYFAYGVTADLKVSWALSDSLLAYLGMRVQYMNGDSPNSDAYLAYGPLLGITASWTPS